jgi:SnoaL-like domain
MAAMDELERLLAERACERLIIEYCRRVDFGNARLIADLFTEDGQWEGVDHRREGDLSLPVPAESPKFVGELHDQFRRTADGWRFARRHVDVTFVRRRSELQSG